METSVRLTSNRGRLSEYRWREETASGIWVAPWDVAAFKSKIGWFVGLPDNDVTTNFRSDALMEFHVPLNSRTICMKEREVLMNLPFIGQYALQLLATHSEAKIISSSRNWRRRQIEIPRFSSS